MFIYNVYKLHIMNIVDAGDSYTVVCCVCIIHCKPNYEIKYLYYNKAVRLTWDRNSFPARQEILGTLWNWYFVTVFETDSHLSLTWAR